MLAATFLKTHKFAIAVISLIGSIAGVAFSVSDVHDQLQVRRRLKSKQSSKP